MLRMPRALALSYFARGIGIWALIRIVAFIGTVLMRGAVGPGARSGTAAPLLVAAAVCIIDFRRRRESTLVANLGIAPTTAVSVMLAPVLAGEALARVLDLP
jgi:hypothetical protein